MEVFYWKIFLVDTCVKIWNWNKLPYLIGSIHPEIRHQIWRSIQSQHNLEYNIFFSGTFNLISTQVVGCLYECIWLVFVNKIVYSFSSFCNTVNFFNLKISNMVVLTKLLTFWKDIVWIMTLFMFSSYNKSIMNILLVRFSHIASLNPLIKKYIKTSNSVFCL